MRPFKYDWIVGEAKGYIHSRWFALVWWPGGYAMELKQNMPQDMEVPCNSAYHIVRWLEEEGYKYVASR